MSNRTGKNDSQHVQAAAYRKGLYCVSDLIPMLPPIVFQDVSGRKDQDGMRLSPVAAYTWAEAREQIDAYDQKADHPKSATPRRHASSDARFFAAINASMQ